MTNGPATTLWARAWVDELARAGVHEVALAPGSRSTPLVLALARDDRFRLRVHLDERSAAFFALGVGRASGRPAAVLTTSGTAAANLLPAVVEAAQSEVPLLVLTADRPGRLRGADANQAIDQVRIFGVYPKAFFETGPATLEADALGHHRQTACRAVAATLGPPAGPVHVNLPFEKPFEPEEDGLSDFESAHPVPALGRPDGAPWVRIVSGRTATDPEILAPWAARLRTERGVIVAGPVPDPWSVGPAVVDLAARSGLPLLADPLSGARFGPATGARRVAAYDLLLRDPEIRAALRPDFVVRIGASPTSATVVDWLSGLGDVPCLVLDGGARWKDHGLHATEYVAADPTITIRALSERVGPADRSRGGDRNVWVARWASADEAARRTLGPTPAVGAPVVEERGGSGPGVPSEARIWAELERTLPQATFFVSSSMPIRDLDAFGVPSDRSWRVFANRGASGIDGIVSTAFGVAAATDGPVVCVLGDVAFFHDQNGLLWSREPDLRVVFVLIDNDGGGIFRMLPVRGHEPEFTRFFVTPHGLDLGHAAALHGMTFHDVSADSIGEAVPDAIASGTTAVLRLRTDGREDPERRRALSEVVASTVRSALRAFPASRERSRVDSPDAPDRSGPDPSSRSPKENLPA